MSDDTTSNDATPGGEAASGEFNWGQLLNDPPKGKGRSADHAPAQGRNLPPFPPNTGILAGRLPIRCDTGKATIQLPEPVKDLHCAVVIPNTGAASDCYKDGTRVCVPNALRAQPINDREIQVILDGGDHVTKGPGWTSGPYPGAQPETRQIDLGVPYVEVVALVGVGCGCDSENWASENEWG